jgi:hypothetical protein
MQIEGQSSYEMTSHPTMHIQCELNRQDAKNAKIIRRVWGIYRAEKYGGVGDMQSRRRGCRDHTEGENRDQGLGIRD